MTMKQKLLFLFFLVISLTSFSQNNILTDKAQISIFTCGRGNELYTTFGHTAIRIKDESNNLDVVYNYGAFDFNTDNFYLKFVKGDLQYFITATSYDDFIYEYQMENREVIEQTLDFSLAQKQQLFELVFCDFWATWWLHLAPGPSRSDYEQKSASQIWAQTSDWSYECVLHRHSYI